MATTLNQQHEGFEDFPTFFCLSLQWITTTIVTMSPLLNDILCAALDTIAQIRQKVCYALLNDSNMHAWAVRCQNHV